MSLNTALMILVLVHLVFILWHLHLIHRRQKVDIWPVVGKEDGFNKYPLVLMEPPEGQVRYIMCHPDDAELLRKFYDGHIYLNDAMKPQVVVYGL